MSTADPTEPTVDQLATLVAGTATIVVAVAAVIILAGVMLFGWMLLRASRHPWPVPIIAPLALLTLVFGLVGVLTPELIPLAGAGLGALAGVLTSQLGRPAGGAGTGSDQDTQLEDASQEDGPPDTT